MRNNYLKEYWRGYNKASSNINNLGLQSASDDYYIDISTHGKSNAYYKGYIRRINEDRKE